MPRTVRASVGGVIYHVLNRGNLGATIFHAQEDYESFIKAILDTRERVPVDVFGYCLMPNHFHLVIRPHEDGDLGRYMRGLLTTHVQRYHQRHQTSGHLWQGRYKAFPIQGGRHLTSVLRYVEGNPVRANLVKSAEKWPYSSLKAWIEKDSSLWRGSPRPRSGNWLNRVKEPFSDVELARLRLCVNRGRPYGQDDWARQTAESLGLESTFRNRGRPKKA